MIQCTVLVRYGGFPTLLKVVTILNLAPICPVTPRQAVVFHVTWNQGAFKRLANHVCCVFCKDFELDFDFQMKFEKN